MQSDMPCDQCREHVSARLDGEDAPDPRVDRHLTGCAACHAFAERAAEVTRLARTGPATAAPDLVDAVLAAPAVVRVVTRRRRLVTAVRAGLAVVGAGQLALAVAGVTGAAVTGHTGIEMAGASMAHAAHETAAWNLALGVGFLAVARGGRRLGSGLVPVIGAFLLVLTGLSVADLIAGRVDAGRLLGHGLIVIGLALLMLHGRVAGDGGGHAIGRPRFARGRATGAPTWLRPTHDEDGIVARHRDAA